MAAGSRGGSGVAGTGAGPCQPPAGKRVSFVDVDAGINTGADPSQPDDESTHLGTGGVNCDDGDYMDRAIVPFVDGDIASGLAYFTSDPAERESLLAASRTASQTGGEIRRLAAEGLRLQRLCAGFGAEHDRETLDSGDAMVAMDAVRLRVEIRRLTGKGNGGAGRPLR